MKKTFLIAAAAMLCVSTSSVWSEPEPVCDGPYVNITKNEVQFVGFASPPPCSTTTPEGEEVTEFLNEETDGSHTLKLTQAEDVSSCNMSDMSPLPKIIHAFNDGNLGSASVESESDELSNISCSTDGQEPVTITTGKQQVVSMSPDPKTLSCVLGSGMGVAFEDSDLVSVCLKKGISDFSFTFKSVKDPSISQPQGTESLSVVTIAEPPFVYIESGKEPYGYLIDMMNALSVRYNISLSETEYAVVVSILEGQTN